MTSSDHGSLPASTPLSVGVHYWRLFGTSGATTGANPSPTWEFFVGVRSAPVDTSWGTITDFNGDGYADVATGTSPSSVQLYLGGAGGLATTPTLTLPAYTLMGICSMRFSQ